MLRNHAPLLVAERFKLLEGLFPNRIDLGLGRAMGADPATSKVIHRHRQIEDDFAERLQDLFLLETRGYPDGDPLHDIHAMPTGVPLPPIWLLGSTSHSAELAASFGTRFSFAHHFAGYEAASAMHAYRDKFRPSQLCQQAYAVLAVHVICADTDADAQHLARSADLAVARGGRRESCPLGSPEEAEAFPFDTVDLERIHKHRAHLFVGSPATVMGQLVPLIELTKADELMVTSLIYDHDARRHCYELLAEYFGLPKA
jgi:luciferase family oxidoreductase group 1